MQAPDPNSRHASLQKSSHRRRINQPRRMTGGDALRGNLSAPFTGFLYHQLLDEEGNGTVVLAQEIGARDTGEGGAGGGRDLGGPSVRTKGLGPLFAIWDVVEEEAIGIDGADGAVGFLRSSEMAIIGRRRNIFRGLTSRSYQSGGNPPKAPIRLSPMSGMKAEMKINLATPPVSPAACRSVLLRPSRALFTGSPDQLWEMMTTSLPALTSCSTRVRSASISGGRSWTLVAWWIEGKATVWVVCSGKWAARGSKAVGGYQAPGQKIRVGFEEVIWGTDGGWITMSMEDGCEAALSRASSRPLESTLSAWCHMPIHPS